MKKLPLLATRSACTACMACVASCKKHAISKCLDTNGHWHIRVDEALCVKCGMCERKCPIASHSVDAVNNLKLSEPFKAWNSNQTQRSQGTSGGVFAALAQHIIEQDGIVIGARMKNNDCKHVAIYSFEEIQFLQGSKYIYSSLDGIYDTIEENLNKHRKVLFSGLPCQTAGVISFFKNHKNRDFLFTIDLVCGGIPSELLKKRFLEEHPGADIISFRQKDKYQLLYKQNEKIINVGSHNLMISGFLSGLAVRKSCMSCRFAGTHRSTDITLGDFWQNSASEEHKKGVSLLLVHTQRGLDLVTNSTIEKESVEWSQFLPYNPRIAIGGSSVQRLPRLEYKVGSMYKHLPKYFFKVMYSSEFKKYDILSLLYLTYKKMMQIIIKKQRDNEIRKILNQDNLNNSHNIR